MSSQDTITSTSSDVILATQPVVGMQQLPEVSTGNFPAPLQQQSIDNIVPVRPGHISDERNAELLAQAQVLVQAILANPMDINITSQLYAIGSDAMSANTQHVSLMDAKIGDVLAEIQTGSSSIKTIAEIKAHLDLVNPSVVSNTEAPFEEKFLGLFKRIVRRLPKSEEVLTIINLRRDTIKTTINGLQRHLWEEKDKALQNALELARVADWLFSTRITLQEGAYQGQIVWSELNKALPSEADSVRKQALFNLVNDLAVQVVDIQSVDNMNTQSRMGAEQLINNARRLQQLIKRITDVLLPAVATNLAVKAAAAQQAALVSIAADITASATKTLVDTAKQTRQAVVQTAKMQSDMLVGMAGLEEACNEYVLLAGEVEQVMIDTEIKARETSQKLSHLAEVMGRHTDPLTLARQAREKAST